MRPTAAFPLLPVLLTTALAATSLTACGNGSGSSPNTLKVSFKQSTDNSVKVMDTYLAPNRTVLELHELMKSGEAAIDPLKEFSEAAREELRAFTSR